MSAAAKRIALIETVKDNKTADVAKGLTNSKATLSNHSLQAEAQRRRWGVETAAVRPVHARKF
jgi:hypothetical protein